MRNDLPVLDLYMGIGVHDAAELHSNIQLGSWNKNGARVYQLMVLVDALLSCELYVTQSISGK